MQSSLSKTQITALASYIRSIEDLVRLNIPLKVIADITKEAFEEQEKSLSLYKVNIIEKEKPNDVDKDTKEEDHLENVKSSNNFTQKKEETVKETQDESKLRSPPSYFQEPDDYAIYWGRFTQNERNIDISLFHLIHNDKNIKTMEQALTKQVIWFYFLLLIKRIYYVLKEKKPEEKLTFNK